ncbi:MAG: hypothetical protein FJ109_15910, partial [Deltaproteobacteria bacterium]|nr:hypothetical protein [Deltaproteobacteria bacterium]
MQLDPARYDAYPFPLVHVYREMLTAEGDPQESFRRLIKCFATALKFCSILAVNDYLNQRPEHPSSEIDSLLKTSLPRPSLGHWCQFLREIVRHLGPRLSLPQLAGFFPKTRVPGRRRTLPEELISVRNTWVHPDVRPAEGEAEKLYHANLPLLSRFLDDLDFLSEASLVGRVGGIQRRLHGSLPDSADVSLSTDFDETVEKEGAGRFGIWSQTPSGRRFLPLSVFLWLGHVSPPDSTTTQERILLFETLRSKKQIFYLLGDWYEFESDGIDEFNSLLGLLGDDETNLRILEDQRADNQASPSWQRLWVP